MKNLRWKSNITFWYIHVTLRTIKELENELEKSVM